MAKKRMTPKERVLARYPGLVGRWTNRVGSRTELYVGSNCIGAGLSPKQAWADAASRLKRTTR